MQIRAYHITDKKAVLQLLRLNTPAYFSPEEEKDFIFYLDHEVEMYFVMEVNAAVIGCGGINFTDENQRAKISWDILHPDYQRKSYGSKLLQHRLQILKNRAGLKKITVRTSQHVWQFYKKHGFHLEKITENYWAEGFDLYEMHYI
jgi:ribosomal protein S18 acetylase RimI-like enzyme